MSNPQILPNQKKKKNQMKQPKRAPLTRTISAQHDPLNLQKKNKKQKNKQGSLFSRKEKKEEGGAGGQEGRARKMEDEDSALGKNFFFFFFFFFPFSSFFFYLLTPPLLYIFKKDKKLSKIAIKDLVISLITNKSSTTSARSLRSAFFLTFHRFSSPLEILKILLKHCQEEMGEGEEGEEAGEGDGVVGRGRRGREGGGLRMIVFLKCWWEEVGNLGEGEEEKEILMELLGGLKNTLRYFCYFY